VWGLGVGALGLGLWPHTPKPKPPIPNPQSPIPKKLIKIKNQEKIINKYLMQLCFINNNLIINYI